MVSPDIAYYLAMDYIAADAINGDDESFYEEYSSKHPPGEPVIPTVRDILCGRGGLTNHNPGNAWFRELVSCRHSCLSHSCPLRLVRFIYGLESLAVIMPLPFSP